VTSTRPCSLLLLAALLAAAHSAAQPGEPQPTPTAPAHALYEATSRRSFADVDHWKSVLDDPSRDAWQRPSEVVTALGIRHGMRVADLGAGTGYFLPHLAAAVGESGTVFAVETEPNLVTHLRERAEREGAQNVVPVLASFDNARLPAACIDLVLIVDTFHHIDQRLTYFRRLRRLLGPRGRVAIIDWRMGELPVGPPPDHRIPREQVVRELGAAGYELGVEPAILPYQYFLVFRPR